MAHIFDGPRGQVVPGPRADRGSVPSPKRFVDRFDAGLGVLAFRKEIDPAAVKPITGANPDFPKTVQNVELGQRNSGDPVCGDRLADRNGVKPAAPALSAGNRAEFMAAFAEKSADVIVLFGRERPFSDRVA